MHMYVFLYFQISRIPMNQKAVNGNATENFKAFNSRFTCKWKLCFIQYVWSVLKVSTCPAVVTVFGGSSSKVAKSMSCYCFSFPSCCYSHYCGLLELFIFSPIFFCFFFCEASAALKWLQCVAEAIEILIGQPSVERFIFILFRQRQRSTPEM